MSAIGSVSHTPEGPEAPGGNSLPADLTSDALSTSRDLQQVAAGERKLGPESKGKGLRLVAKALRLAGYDLPESAANGRWHPELETALKAFQEHYDLDMSGRVDSATVLSLDRLFANATATHKHLAEDGMVDAAELAAVEAELATTMGAEQARGYLTAMLGHDPKVLSVDAVGYLQGTIGSMDGHIARYQQVLTGHLKDAQLLDANFNGRFDSDDLIFSADAQGQVNVKRIGAALRDRVAIGAAVVDAAYAMDSANHRFGGQPQANETYWRVPTNPVSGASRMLVRDGVRPSAALQDMFENPGDYRFECASAIVIIRYKAIMDLIGKADFDRIMTDMIVGAWKQEADSEALWKISRTGPTKTPPVDPSAIPEVPPGEYTYFRNWDVSKEGFDAGWQGENVIALGDGLYYGHPFGVVSDDEIIKHLNQNRKAGSTQSATLLNLRARIGRDVFKHDLTPE